jgi:UDP-3-O-[3-hydroxymyristoyl] glucosamine N-acyltransferase
MSKRFTMQAVAEAVEGQLTGDGQWTVTRLAHPADIASSEDLVLAMDAKLLPLIEKNPPRAVIMNKGAVLPAGKITASIIVDRPRLAMAKLTQLFAEPANVPPGIHPTAVIEAGATIGKNVAIGAQSYIGAGAVIGDGCILHPRTYVAPRAVIGEGGLIYPGVCIASHVTIGKRCIIHFNASIGADGFSFVTPQLGSVEEAKAGGSDEVTARNESLIRIASLGGVVIGDDVEIGANSSIDQGTIAPTRIGNGTKIDNQVQIGHNVVIGDNCMICGRAGIAGSASIGNRVVLGGAVGVADHVTIGDDAVVMAMSGVGGNVQARTVVGGFPAVPRERLMQNYTNMGRLKQFYRKIEGLIERMDHLEQGKKE